MWFKTTKQRLFHIFLKFFAGAPRLIHIILVVIIVISFSFCQQTKKFRGEKLNTGFLASYQGERLAKEKCSGCHLTPQPSELEQYTWEYVLAYMGLYFGVGSEKRLSFDENFLRHYRLRVALTTHQKTTGIAGELSKDDFYLLRNYYLVKSTENPPPVLPIWPVAESFTTSEFNRSKAPAVSLLKYHNEKLYIGDAAAAALEIHDLRTGQSRRLPADSPPVAIQFAGKETYVTLIGDLLGTAPEIHSAALARLEAGQLRPMLKHLTRTAGVLVVDINKNDCADLLNPGFGAPLSGGIFLHTDFCHGNAQEQILLQRDGAVAILPYTIAGRQGYLIAFANAREGLSFLEFDNGEPKFTELLELPATTGLTSMKTGDFSGNGNHEILLTGGDNADAGPYNTIKPAMGVRIFSLNGAAITEKYFFHYPGAFNAAVGDLNRDGLQDFVVVSYFSDLRKNHPDDVLLFLNEGNFRFRVLRLPAEGRFSTVEIADTNRDGWPDILLGRAELPYQQRVDGAIKTRTFPSGRAAVLILQNTGYFSK